MYTHDTFLITLIVLVATVAYLLGSIPFGIVLARLFGLPDPRTVGSGNIGATNMLRTGNKKVALLTLLLDAGKGYLAVEVAWYVLGNVTIGLAVATLMVALGHMYSPWLKFNGGKGVATILGAALAIHLYLGLAFCVVWLALFLLTSYVSLASIVALTSIPLVLGYFFGLDPSYLLIVVAVGVAIYKHRANIARLQAGTEPKMRGKKHA